RGSWPRRQRHQPVGGSLGPLASGLVRPLDRSGRPTDSGFLYGGAFEQERFEQRLGLTRPRFKPLAVLVPVGVGVEEEGIRNLLVELLVTDQLVHPLEERQELVER